ncbi:MAG: hypothetical protein M1814_004766 [Vezdaea aestivalis]|nr:MAG: hypothetical protein M1814_004766 [Vezdaea aestivalis]
MAWFSGPGSSYSGHSHHSNSGRHHSSSSYYKRSPREGYVSHMIRKVRRMLRDLWYYAQRHPVKVFTLVILPLLTGGALTKILATMGVRLPPGLFGGSGRGGGFGGSSYGEYGESSGGGGLANLAGMAAGGGGVGSVIQLAKMFM